VSARPKYIEKTPDERRRAAIAKLHCAKRDLRLDDDAYRAILRQVTGKESGADLDAIELGAVLDKMARLGFVSPRTLAMDGGPGGPQQRKAQALWHDLGEMGVLDDPEGGLRRFARHLVGVEALEWADANQMNKVIEALKAWRARERLKRALQ
jgi:phage gp16-like protein